MLLRMLNKMEIQYKKHVKIICDLEIGDTVFIKGWGYKLDGKDWKVEDVKFSRNCESGFMVKIDGYENYMDSNWLNKKVVQNKLDLA